MTRLTFTIRSAFAEVSSWFRAVVGRGDLEAEMDAELADHIERLTADLIAAGHSPSDAARRARIALGSIAVHKAEIRTSVGLHWFDELTSNIRYGIRILRKSPGFTLIAAASLALAIGANSTIIAIGKQLLFDRLNVPHPEELRMLRWTGDGKQAVHGMWGDFDSSPGGGTNSSVFSYPIYQQLRAQNQELEDLVAFKEDSMNATVRGNAQRVNAAMVSGNFYGAAGVRAQLGRTLQPSDDAAPGSGFVAVISDVLWQREFGRSPSVLGQSINLNQTVLTIVGVNPRGFTGVKNVQQTPEIFVPISLQPIIDPKGKNSLLSDQALWWVNIVGRTRPGISDSVARAALDVQLQAAVRATMPIAAGETFPRLELADGSRGLHYSDEMFKKPLYVLAALTGFVVLLACANIANLLLARGAQRQREMSVRLAMGAGRGRILRQLLTESLMLALLGGVGGLLLAYAGRNAVPRLLENAWERNTFTTPIDWSVFFFTAGVTMLTGVLFGLAPAWIAARAEVSSTLKETAQSLTRRRRGISGKTIVAFQIALSTLLVLGAGLFLRSVVKLNAVNVGFNADNLILFDLSPPVRRYPAPKDVQLHAQLEQRLSRLPGVEQLVPVTTPYIAQNVSNTDFLPEGEAVDSKKYTAEYVNSVGTAFFPTMGIPIIAGRGFDRSDTPSSLKVAVINEVLARKRFPGIDPVGKRFKADRDGPASEWITIVGICADTKYSNLNDDPPGQFFLPYFQQSEVGSMVYQVRTRIRPTELEPSIRRVVQDIDRDLPIIDLRTQREQINATMQVQRALAAMTTGFGVLALSLACVGIYGVMAYSVAQRTNEIGIRLALGARPVQLLWMVLRESTGITLIGIVAGVGVALVLARTVKSMLYGIQSYDPLTFISAVSILMTVALAAGLVPARRAAGVQPMEALRHE